MMDLDDIVEEINNRMRRLTGAPLKPTRVSIQEGLQQAHQEIQKALEDVEEMRRETRKAHQIPDEYLFRK